MFSAKEMLPSLAANPEAGCVLTAVVVVAAKRAVKGDRISV